MNEWFQAGDILILDRGYRDAIPLLNSKGIIHKMPGMLKPGQKQLTTEEANQTRLVTKIRWKVEMATSSQSLTFLQIRYL